MLMSATGRCALPCRLWAPLLRRQGRRCRQGDSAPPLAVCMQAGAQQQQQQPASAAAAAVHTATPAHVRDLDRLQLDVESRLGFPLEIYQAAGRHRVRQHVNPLQKELQIPTEPPAWQEVYAQPQRPLVLDIGCGYGRFLLALNKEMPEHNLLGLEIRGPIIERANKWAEILEVQTSVLFLRGNATITLDHTLASYPGSLDLVCVQFPDPHFKARHKKRNTVQAQTVQALGRLMRPGARVFLQSDVLQAAEHMRDMFEQHGSSWFAPCQHLHAGPTFHAASATPQGPQRQGEQQQQQQQQEGQERRQQQQQQEGGEEGQQLQQEEPKWQSQWAAAGWLRENPLGVPTEREVLTTAQKLPVYRIMLTRL